MYGLIFENFSGYIKVPTNIKWQWVEDFSPRYAAKVRGGGLGQCQEAGQHRLAHLLHPPGDGRW